MKDTHNTCIWVSFFLPFYLFAFLLFMACSNDAYDTGDSRYSYLRADFVEATTNGQGRFVSAITDDGATLTFSKDVAMSWANKADSTYRALFYYNAGDTAKGHIVVEPVSIARVYVLRPSSSDTLKAANDPVGFQSAWLSHNKKYVNLGIILMTGQTEETDLRQSIGLVCDSIVERGGSHKFFYRLVHNQGGVPQYYSQSVYISIPLTDMREGDALFVQVNTYNGLLTRSFLLNP